MQLEFKLEKDQENKTSESAPIVTEPSQPSNVFSLEDRRKAKAYAELLANAEAAVKW